jgi:hypothetical protein
MIERHDGGGSVIALQECVVKEVVARTAKPSVAKSDRQTASQSGRQGWMDGGRECKPAEGQAQSATRRRCWVLMANWPQRLSEKNSVSVWWQVLALACRVLLACLAQ